MTILLHTLKNTIDKELVFAIQQMGDKSTLRDACEYALMGKGKRVRPIIVLLTAKSFISKQDVMNAALAVEFFHTASLIADDLPCMDNDDRRRDRLSLHKVFGEGTALLASYTLIALGYSYIQKNAEVLRKISGYEQKADLVCSLALQVVSDLSGFSGATHGQYLDLFPPDNNIETVKKIMYQKTVTLFEIAFSLGWLFGGGEIHGLDEIRSCAFHFGMAFQMTDDIADLLQDRKNNYNSNLASLLGVSEAINLFRQECDLFIKKLSRVNTRIDDFRILISYLKKLVDPLNLPIQPLQR